MNYDPSIFCYYQINQLLFSPNCLASETLLAVPGCSSAQEPDQHKFQMTWNQCDVVFLEKLGFKMLPYGLIEARSTGNCGYDPLRADLPGVPVNN